MDDFDLGVLEGDSDPEILEGVPVSGRPTEEEVLEFKNLMDENFPNWQYRIEVGRWDIQAIGLPLPGVPYFRVSHYPAAGEGMQWFIDGSPYPRHGSTLEEALAHFKESKWYVIPGEPPKPPPDSPWQKMLKLLK